MADHAARFCVHEENGSWPEVPHRVNVNIYNLCGQMRSCGARTTEATDDTPGGFNSISELVCERLCLLHAIKTRSKYSKWVGCLLACLTSQQQASVSQGRICLDNFTCCHTEIEVADQTFYLTQSQYTDTGPTSPSADPITPGAWQGSHWSANFEVTGMTRPRKNPGASGIRTRDLPLSRRTP